MKKPYEKPLVRVVKIHNHVRLLQSSMLMKGKLVESSNDCEWDSNCGQ